MPPTPFPVRALFEFQADEPDDLPFAPGQRLMVDAQLDDDWFHGYYVETETGKRLEGIFPINYVEIEAPPARPTRPRPKTTNLPEPANSSAESAPISDLKPTKTQPELNATSVSSAPAPQPGSVPQPNPKSPAPAPAPAPAPKTVDAPAPAPAPAPKSVGAPAPESTLESTLESASESAPASTPKSAPESVPAPAPAAASVKANEPLTTSAPSTTATSSSEHIPETPKSAFNPLQTPFKRESSKNDDDDGWGDDSEEEDCEKNIVFGAPKPVLTQPTQEALKANLSDSPTKPSSKTETSPAAVDEAVSKLEAKATQYEAKQHEDAKAELSEEQPAAKSTETAENQPVESANIDETDSKEPKLSFENNSSQELSNKSTKEASDHQPEPKSDHDLSTETSEPFKEPVNSGISHTEADFKSRLARFNQTETQNAEQTAKRPERHPTFGKTLAIEEESGDAKPRARDAEDYKPSLSFKERLAMLQQSQKEESDAAAADSAAAERRAERRAQLAAEAQANKQARAEAEAREAEAKAVEAMELQAQEARAAKELEAERQQRQEASKQRARELEAQANALPTKQINDLKINEEFEASKPSASRAEDDSASKPDHSELAVPSATEITSAPARSRQTEAVDESNDHLKNADSKSATKPEPKPLSNEPDEEKENEEEEEEEEDDTEARRIALRERMARLASSTGGMNLGMIMGGGSGSGAVPKRERRISRSEYAAMSPAEIEAAEARREAEFSAPVNMFGQTAPMPPKPPSEEFQKDVESEELEKPYADETNEVDESKTAAEVKKPAPTEPETKQPELSPTNTDEVASFSKTNEPSNPREQRNSAGSDSFDADSDFHFENSTHARGPISAALRAPGVPPAPAKSEHPYSSLVDDDQPSGEVSAPSTATPQTTAPPKPPPATATSHTSQEPPLPPLPPHNQPKTPHSVSPAIPGAPPVPPPHVTAPAPVPPAVPPVGPSPKAVPAAPPAAPPTSAPVPPRAAPAPPSAPPAAPPAAPSTTTVPPAAPSTVPRAAPAAPAVPPTAPPTAPPAALPAAPPTTAPAVPAPPPAPPTAPPKAPPAAPPTAAPAPPAAARPPPPVPSLSPPHASTAPPVPPPHIPARASTTNNAPFPSETARSPPIVPSRSSTFGSPPPPAPIGRPVDPSHAHQNLGRSHEHSRELPKELPEWIKHPQGAPPNLVNENEFFHVKNKTNEREFIVVHKDFSQTVVSYSLATGEQLLKRQVSAPDSDPARLKQLSARLGPQVVETASRNLVDPNDHSRQWCCQVLQSVPEVVIPRQTAKPNGASFGVEIYTNVGNASVQILEEIRPGDICVCEDANFQGTKGPLHRYQRTLVNESFVVSEWDGSKRKLHLVDTKKDSLRLNDLRMGVVRVYRPVDLTYLGYRA